MFDPRLCALAAATAVIALPSVALACSCAFEEVHAIISGETIPENGRLLIGTMRPPDVTATVGGEPREATIDYDLSGADHHVVKLEGVKAGDVVHVESKDAGGKSVSGKVAIGPPVSADQEISMAVAGPTRKPIAIAAPISCARTVDAVYFDITFSPSSPELKKYADSVVTRVEKDGAPLKPWTSSMCQRPSPSGSELGRHRFRVYESCKAGEESSVERSIKLIAELPGSGLSWETEQTIEFVCTKNVPLVEPDSDNWDRLRAPDDDGSPPTKDEQPTQDEQPTPDKAKTEPTPKAKKASCSTVHAATPSHELPVPLFATVMLLGLQSTFSRREDA